MSRFQSKRSIEIGIIAVLAVAVSAWILYRSTTPWPATIIQIAVVVAVGGIIISSRDAERRRVAEQRLRESEERYRVVAETASDGIITINEESRILFANAAAARIFNYRVEDLVGMSMEKLLPERLRAAHTSGVARYIETGERQLSWAAIELTGLRRDGREMPIELSLGAFKGDDGQHVFTGIVRDITERKRNEEVRQHLAAIIESTEDAVYGITSDGKIFSWNTGATILYGYEGKEILNQPLEILIPPERLNELETVFNIPLTGQSIKNYDTVRLHRSGERLDVSLTISPLKNERGEITGVSTIARDISYRLKRDEETRKLIQEQAARVEAEASLARSALLAEASRVLATSLVYEETLSSISRLAVPELADWCAVDMLEESGEIRRLAVTHADNERAALEEVIREQYPPRSDDALGVVQVLRTGRAELYPQVTDETIRRLARDEEHLALLRRFGARSAMIVPLRNGEKTVGALSFVICDSMRLYTEADLETAKDLANRASLAIENAVLYQSAQNANRIKDEFLSTLSHELRTPLTAILGWSNLLRNEKQFDDEGWRRALEIIERNALVQKKLIDDLLEVSRIVTGKMRLNLRPVPLSEVIMAAIDAVRPAAEGKEITLSAAFDHKEDVTVVGDPDRLQQIFWNLLSNAIKFTPDGGQVAVTIRRVEGGYLEASVTDTGVGIRADFLSYVFERFRQADNTKTRTYGGLGLGLAIARMLTETHGGTIRAESPGIGKGSTFTVKLPLKRAKRKARGTPDEQTLASLPSTALSLGNCDLENTRVLVIDDTYEARELLRAIIEHCGGEAFVAASAAEACSVLEQVKVNMMLCDIGMPDEDGLSFIRRVRAAESERGRKRLPAIALTAYASRQDEMEALEAGFDIHLAKPVDAAAIVAAIQRALPSSSDGDQPPSQEKSLALAKQPADI